MKDKEKPRGHGRNGADAYRGAKRVRVPLATLQAGDACPCCAKGKVYVSCEPGRKAWAFPCRRPRSGR